MKEIVKYSGCFVCGDLNECGLRAGFYYDGRQAVAEVEVGRRFEGYRGICHGGIIAALLDEAMIKAILAIDRYAVTAELTVRFLRPVRTGDTIKLTGWVTRSKGRVFLTEGRAESADGQLMATARGRYVEADSNLRKELLRSID